MKEVYTIILTLYCQIIDENGDTLLSDEIKTT